jgi:hypothetical protein
LPDRRLPPAMRVCWNADMQGPAAHEAGVVFPTDEAMQKRMMVVGNLSKSINAEQV